MKTKQTSATNQKNTVNRNQKESFWSSWITMHKAAFDNALQRLSLAPITALLTILVVGVSLSLPAAFQILVKNLESGQQSIDEQSRISLYLTKNASSADIENLLSEIKTNNAVKEAVLISSEQGLKDFQQHNILGNALDLLSDNPLPAVIQVYPDTRKLDPNQIESLSNELAEFALIDKANIDVLWLKRLFSITEFVKQISLAISLFLIFTVLIVIGNTIKLLGQDFQDEIAVNKLVGATDGYVRRPFLYSGLLYGVLGGVVALCIILLGLLWITPQIDQIAQLYQSQISLVGLGFSDILSILGTGMILGLGGAWVAANRLIHSLSI